MPQKLVATKRMSGGFSRIHSNRRKQQPTYRELKCRPGSGKEETCETSLFKAFLNELLLLPHSAEDAAGDSWGALRVAVNI